MAGVERIAVSVEKPRGRDWVSLHFHPAPHLIQAGWAIDSRDKILPGIHTKNSARPRESESIPMRELCVKLVHILPLLFYLGERGLEDSVIKTNSYAFVALALSMLRLY